MQYVRNQVRANMYIGVWLKRGTRMDYSNLSLKLLELCGQGYIGAATVQKLAAAAWEDGWGRNCRLAEHLKRIGTSGKHSKNALRDLVRATEACGVSTHAYPSEYEAPVRCKGGIRMVPCYLPTEVIHKMSVPQINEMTLSEEDRETTHLGQTLRDWGQSPDVNLTAEQAWKAIALGLRADGVQYTQGVRVGAGKSMFAIDWNVLSGSEKTRSKRYLFATLSYSSLCDCGCQGYHSIQDLFDVFAWDLRQSLLGVCSTNDHTGKKYSRTSTKRLRRGTRLHNIALLQVRGDWEFLVKAFRFRNVNSDSFCWRCDATLSDGPTCYKAFNYAVHELSLLRHDAYVMACVAEEAQISKLFECPGGRW